MGERSDRQYRGTNSPADWTARSFSTKTPEQYKEGDLAGLTLQGYQQRDEAANEIRKTALATTSAILNPNRFRIWLTEPNPEGNRKICISKLFSETDSSIQNYITAADLKGTIRSELMTGIDPKNPKKKVRVYKFTLEQFARLVTRAAEYEIAQKNTYPAFVVDTAIATAPIDQEIAYYKAKHEAIANEARNNCATYLSHVPEVAALVQDYMAKKIATKPDGPAVQ